MPNRTAVFKPTQGTIRFELLEEDAPKTTETFACSPRRVSMTRDFSPMYQRLHDSRWRSRRAGRGGQSAWGGKFADEIIHLQRFTNAVQSRHRRHGQWRPKHQRLAFFIHAR